MNNRLWILGALLLIVAMIAGTYLIGVAPQLASISDSKTKLQTAQAQNAGYQATLDTLAKDEKNKGKLAAELEDLQKQVPPGLEQTALLSQLAVIAERNAVTIQSITFEDPTVYVPLGSTDADVAAASASVSSGNFYVVELSLQVQGTENAVLSFLRDVQKGTRLFLAYEVEFSAAGDDPNAGVLTFGILGQVFVLNDGGTGAPADGSVVPDGTTIDN
jgi:type II secretory pathway component PulM